MPVVKVYVDGREVQGGVPAVVRVEIQTPEGFSGILSAFPPGSTESKGWNVGSKQSVEVSLAVDGALTVNATIAPGVRYSLNEKPGGLVLYVQPGIPLRVNGKVLRQLAIPIIRTPFDWYWGGSTALWEDGSRDVFTADPAQPIGVRLVRVEPLPGP